MADYTYIAFDPPAALGSNNHIAGAVLDEIQRMIIPVLSCINSVAVAGA
ncbi:hypothetical protein [Pseudomonas sp. IC_126]|nr:hypothetical protein [Pseudomonas sp. IC_126]